MNSCPKPPEFATARVRVATAGDHAISHRMERNALAVVRPIANDSRIWPAGYMWASAIDVSRALFALLHQGRVGDQQGLPTSVVTSVMTPRTPMPNVFVGGHYGIAILSNLDNAPLRRIAQSVLTRVLGLSEPPPPARGTKRSSGHRRRDETVSRPLSQSRHGGVDDARPAGGVDSR